MRTPRLTAFYRGRWRPLVLASCLLVLTLPCAATALGDCSGPVDCPTQPMPFTLPNSNTRTGPFAFDLGAADGNPAATCFNTNGQILGVSGTQLNRPSTGFFSEELQFFTSTPAIETLAGGLVTTHAMTGSFMHAGGVDCKQNCGVLTAAAFAASDKAIGVVQGGQYLEFLLPVGVTPETCAGIGSCNGGNLLFSFNVQTSDDLIHSVIGGQELTFPIPNPIVDDPPGQPAVDSWSNGPRAGVVTYDLNNAYVIEAGSMTTIALGGSYISRVAVGNGVLVTTTTGNVLIPLAPGVTVIPFEDCSTPMRGNPIQACIPPLPATVAINVGTCTDIKGVSAGWPANGVACEDVSKYHFLGVANDEFVGDNNRFVNLMTFWDNWTTDAGIITQVDDRTGVQILADIQTWAQAIEQDQALRDEDCDVAVFHYSGSSGISGDTNGDERTGNEPPFENDEFAGGNPADVTRDVDEVIGRLDPALLPGERVIEAPATDDEIANALMTLPEDTPLIAVFDTCYAGGQSIGTDDISNRPGTAVLMSCGEAEATDIAPPPPPPPPTTPPPPLGGPWTGTMLQGFADLNGDGFGDADTTAQNNRISIDEWFDFTVSLDPPGGSTTRRAGDLENSKDLHVFLNPSMLPLTGGPGAAARKGEDGSGVCSVLDFGDLPDSYQTTVAANGPRYDEWTLQRLGALVDGEPDGQPSFDATGDDIGGPAIDDEDGVQFFPDRVVVTVTIAHPDPKDYRLDAWFDVDRNGTFTEPNEHLIDSSTANHGLNGLLQGLGTGSHEFTFPILNAEHLPSRFRLTFGVPTTTHIAHFDVTPGAYRAADGATHGEVEDYANDPLAVTLSSFTWAAGDGSVVLRWSTESEVDNLGFHVLRSSALNNKFEAVSGLILAQGGPGFGAQYEFIDNTVEPRQTYYYMLEDVDTAGVSALHGAGACTIAVDPSCEPLEVVVPWPSAGEFCSGIRVQAGADRQTCMNADWKENEPGERPRDCHVVRDRGSKTLSCEATAGAD